MKVYRSLAYNASEKENEAAYLLQGYCAPSQEFTRYSKNPRGKLNSFTDKNLGKYFYPSILDALNWAINLAIKYHLSKEPINYVIWEVDLPDKVVNNYLGIGKYNVGPYSYVTNDYRIECKIPYWILASYLSLGLENPYIEGIKDYFNDHYFLENLTFTEKTNLLEALKIDHSVSDSELYSEIYKALIFNLYMPYQILTDLEDNAWLNEAYKIAYANRNKNHSKWVNNMRNNFQNWATVGHGPVEDYLYNECEFLQRENEQIKRALTKASITFQKH